MDSVTFAISDYKFWRTIVEFSGIDNLANSLPVAKGYIELILETKCIRLKLIECKIEYGVVYITLNKESEHMSGMDVNDAAVMFNELF